MAPKLTAQDKKWRAQEDAHTLSRVNEITTDKPRLEAAKKAATEMLAETKKRASSLQKVVKTKTPAKAKAKAPAKAPAKAKAKAPVKKVAPKAKTGKKK